MTTFILVRHGETQWNREGRIQGHSDSVLTDEGIEQARSIGTRLREEEIDHFVSSDLGRAKHTASLIAADIGLEIHPDSRLRERAFGVAEGLTYLDIDRQFPEMFSRIRETDPHFSVQGGESRAQFSERIVAAIGDLAAQHSGKRVLIVTHGGVLAAIYRWLNKLPISSPHKIEIPNVAYNRIRLDGGQWRIEAWGDTHHLPVETNAEPI